MGSWKIMAMSLPRKVRIFISERVRRSVPSNRMLPVTWAGGSGNNRRIDMEVTDLPQPDSPTMATTSPSLMEKLIPLTARLVPSWLTKWVVRFSTSSNAILLAFDKTRVDKLAQAIAQQVHRQHTNRKEQCREENHERLHLPKRTRIGDDIAPARHNRRQTGPNERKNRL